QPGMFLRGLAETARESDGGAPMTAPVEFQPVRDRFYTMAALEQHLSGIMTVKTFLAMLELECTGRDRMSQAGLWGFEIALAMRRRAVRLQDARGAALETDTEQRQSKPAPPVKRKRGRPAKNETSRRRITASDIGLDRGGR